MYVAEKIKSPRRLIIHGNIGSLRIADVVSTIGTIGNQLLILFVFLVRTSDTGMVSDLSLLSLTFSIVYLKNNYCIYSDLSRCITNYVTSSFNLP
jgi:hypothetical protein